MTDVEVMTSMVKQNIEKKEKRKGKWAISYAAMGDSSVLSSHNGVSVPWYSELLIDCLCASQVEN